MAIMKTVLFCAVALSLLTVGWTAPLVCEKLSKPAEKQVDVSLALYTSLYSMMVNKFSMCAKWLLIEYGS